jgi:GAF domain-containing protein
MTRKQDYFKAICNVSKAFGTTTDQEVLLDLIVQSAIDSMNGKAACLFLEDDHQDIFIPMAQKGLSKNYLHANVISASRLAKGILEEGYFVFENATSDPRLENHDAKKAEGIASILTVPVVVNNRVIGILSLYTGKKRKFKADEIEFLSALAEQGGMAIIQTQLLERIRKNSRIFLKLASGINASFDVKKIMEILTAEVSDVLTVKGATVRLVNNDTGNLDLVASYGMSDQFLEKGPVSMNKSAAEVLEGKTVTIEDAVKDKRVQYPDSVKKEGIASMVAVPIKSREAVIGVLRIFSGIHRKFTDEEIVMLEALAHQGGLAIQNAVAYISLAEDKKALEEDIWSHRQWF